MLKKITAIRKVLKIGDSHYIRIGAFEMEQLNNPEILSTTFEIVNPEEEKTDEKLIHDDNNTETKCRFCQGDIIINKEQDIIDCPICGESYTLSSEFDD